MEHYGTSWDSMEYQGTHHATSMEYLWTIFGTPMQYQAISWMPIEKYVAPKDYLWNSYETQGHLMVHLLEIYGMSTAYALMPSQQRG